MLYNYHDGKPFFTLFSPLEKYRKRQICEMSHKKENDASWLNRITSPFWGYRCCPAPVGKMQSLANFRSVSSH